MRVARRGIQGGIHESIMLKKIDEDDELRQEGEDGSECNIKAPNLIVSVATARNPGRFSQPNRRLHPLAHGHGYAEHLRPQCKAQRGCLARQQHFRGLVVVSTNLNGGHAKANGNERCRCILEIQDLVWPLRSTSSSSHVDMLPLKQALLAQDCGTLYMGAD